MLSYWMYVCKMHSCLSCQRQPDGSSMAAEISQKICLNWEIIKCHCSSFWIFELVMPLSILLPFPVFDKSRRDYGVYAKKSGLWNYVLIYLNDSVILIEKLSLILIRNRVNLHLNPIPISTGQNLPIVYEYHVTTASRNRVKRDCTLYTSCTYASIR